MHEIRHLLLAIKVTVCPQNLLSLHLGVCRGWQAITGLEFLEEAPTNLLRAYLGSFALTVHQERRSSNTLLLTPYTQQKPCT